MDYKKILIAVDNSACSEKAAKAGYGLASKFNAQVALVNIIEPMPTTVNTEFSITPVFMEMYENNNENSHLLLKQIETMFSNGVPTTYLSVLDTATHGIITQAEEWGADLIVIGTHGRTGIHHFLMGSVAEHVARKSACPVMIVPNKFEI